MNQWNNECRLKFKDTVSWCAQHNSNSWEPALYYALYLHLWQEEDFRRKIFFRYTKKSLWEIKWGLKWGLK